MSGKSCKVYFNNNEERKALALEAALNQMELSEYLHACAIKVTNEIYAQRAAAQQEASDNAEATGSEDSNTEVTEGGDQEVAQEGADS